MASETVEPTPPQDASASPTTGPVRSRLVQRLLGSSTHLPAFINDLLGTMAVVVAGSEAAGFLVERRGDVLELRSIAHIRPDESDEATRAAAIKAFQEIVLPCVRQGKDGAIEVGTPDAGEPQFCLVTLLRAEGQLVATAAVITRCRDQERARQRLQSMQLVAGYFELYTMRRAVDQAKAIAQSHQNVLQLSAAVGAADGFESAAMNLCNELATRTGASRVALGWMKGTSIKLRALSHTEKFDKKQELVVQLERVMEECLDQGEPVRVDADGQRSDNVTREAEALSRSQSGCSVFSVPLRMQDEVEGVVTLEFAAPGKLGAAMAETLVTSADLLAPAIKDRYDNSRFIAVKVGLSIRDAAELAMGPKHMVAKMVTAGVILVLLILCFYKPMYHVSAPFQLAAQEKQTIAAPFEGRIEEVMTNPATGQRFKAGDFVSAGQLLVRMNTDEVEQKLAEAQAKAQGARATRQRDWAEENKVAESAIADAEEQEALAEVGLYQIMMKEAQIKAPYDGIILNGEIDQREGSPEHMGAAMFEVARMDKPRAELAVSERDIQELRVGQKMELATNSYPGQEFAAHVERIVPEGVSREGENTFKVMAKLDEQAAWMRPGMAGEARVDTTRRRLIWIWTHRLVDFLRLKLWM